MTRLLGVIGYPLGQSISPAFQQAALDHLGLDARYERWEIPPDQLGQRIRGLRTDDLLGFNVTVPHKQALIPLLDEVTEEAQAIGAVNAVLHRDGRLVGHNTDAPGFLSALREEAGFDPQGARVLVLGAGGAARAVCYALLHAGVGSIAIANRTPERAWEMALTLDTQGATVAAVPLEPGALEQLLDESPSMDLVVNCTSLGMFHGPDPQASPLESRLISPRALVYDLVYNPPETPLLQAARRAGAKSLGGLFMLVYQGAEAFRLWTDCEPPVEVMMQAAYRALASK